MPGVNNHTVPLMPKYNPFRPNSIVTPGMFRGRYDEIRRIEQALFQTKHGNPHHFLIEGERGIGKSSLFLLVDYEAKGEIACDGGKLNMLVASVELRESMDFNDIVNEIITDLRRQLSAREQIKELCKKLGPFCRNLRHTESGTKIARRKYVKID